MLSVRLTTLSAAASFIAGMVLILCIWSYIERGRTIEEQKASMASKDNVIGLVADRGKTEEGINHDKDSRIAKLDASTPDKNAPMSRTLRAAIDSLYE